MDLSNAFLTLTAGARDNNLFFLLKYNNFYYKIKQVAADCFISYLHNNCFQNFALIYSILLGCIV